MTIIAKHDFAAPLGLRDRLTGALRRHRHRRAPRLGPADLPDHLLRDIGLSRDHLRR